MSANESLNVIRSFKTSILRFRLRPPLSQKDQQTESRDELPEIATSTHIIRHVVVGILVGDRTILRG